MPMGVGGPGLSNPPVKPAEGSLWAFVNGAWIPTSTVTVQTTFDTGAANGALPSPVVPSSIVMGAADGGTVFSEGRSFGGQGLFYNGVVAGGTRAAPSAIADGTFLIGFQGYGYDGATINSGGGPALMGIRADGLWSGANHGTYYEWQATANGSTTRGLVARLQGGNLCIGSVPTTMPGSGGLRLLGTTASTTPLTGTLLIGDGSTASTNVGIGGGSIFAGANVNAGAAGVFKVNGTQVVGARITGYGTPTGNVQTASFPGATATLAQTSAELAQLILDLKTHGLLGT